MKIKRSRRLRKVCRNSALFNSLELLESRMLLSADHALLAAPAIALNTPPTDLKLNLSNGVIKGSFKDPDKTDAHTVTVNWGDGTTSVPLHLPAGVKSFQIDQKQFQNAGAYNAVVMVTDDDVVGTHSGITLNFNNYDLAISVPKAPHLANTMISGILTTGFINVTLTNNGFSDSPAGTISLHLHPSGGGADVDLEPTSLEIPNLIRAATNNHGLTKTNSKSFRVNVTIPASIAAGDYSLLITLADGETGGAAANNTFTLPDFNFTVLPGHTSVSTTLTTSGIPATIIAGSTVNGTFTLTFSNTGNIPSTAIFYNIVLALRPSSGQDIPLITFPHRGVPIIKADDDAHLTINLTLSAIASAAIPAGSYTLIAVLTPVVGSNPTPITASGPTFLFTASGAHHDSGILIHGDTIDFTTLHEFGPVTFPVEEGTFVTNLGVHGTFTVNGGEITLTYTDGDFDMLEATYLTLPTYLDPAIDASATTVIFSTSHLHAFINFHLSANPSVRGFGKFA